MTANKQYKFEIQVTRGWGQVEDVKIATGTDNPDELKDLVNTMAMAMQDRADNHAAQVREIENARRQAEINHQKQLKELESTNNDGGITPEQETE